MYVNSLISWERGMGDQLGQAPPWMHEVTQVKLQL